MQIINIVYNVLTDTCLDINTFSFNKWFQLFQYQLFVFLCKNNLYTCYQIILKTNNTMRRLKKLREEIQVEDKQILLQEQGFEKFKLIDKKYCIHCDKEITVGDYKVFVELDGFKSISCPNAPKCDGTVIDWIDFKVD